MAVHIAIFYSFFPLYCFYLPSYITFSLLFSIFRVAICEKFVIDLSKGYLFRPTTPQGDIVHTLLSSSTAQQRLRVSLKETFLDEGETLHSFRSGCAITFALSGAQLADVMTQVGWKNGQTAFYYMKLGEVLRQGSSSYLLSCASDGTSNLSSLNTSLDFLKNFICAFPSCPSGAVLF